MSGRVSSASEDRSSSNRSIEEAIFDVPMEIIRQTSTDHPMLEGKTCGIDIGGFKAYLNAYAQVKARLWCRTWRVVRTKRELADLAASPSVTVPADT